MAVRVDRVRVYVCVLCLYARLVVGAMLHCSRRWCVVSLWWWLADWRVRGY